MTMIRFGLLSLVVMIYVIPVLFMAPVTFDLSRWYATIGLLLPLTIVALATYGFWISMAGRPLFRDELFGVAPARA